MSPRPKPRRIRSLVPRPRAIAAFSFAAAASVAVGLVAGYTLGHGSGFQKGFSRPMHGVGSAAAARALIKVGKEDANGNRPLQMSVRALPALSKSSWYELDLTKKGKAVVACGIFETGRSGTANVRMNAPADLAEYDGWIVTALGPGQEPHVLLST